MATGEYVDIDIYGRGFDGVFGPGAEEANKRQALLTFMAKRRFKERVKPGEYIDLDLYGRGDPRIFGPNAHLQTQKEAQRHLKEAQRRKKERKRCLRVAVFPPKLRAVAKKFSAFLRRIPSSGTDEEENDTNATPTDDMQRNEEDVLNREALHPIEQRQENSENVAVFERDAVDKGHLPAEKDPVEEKMVAADDENVERETLAADAALMTDGQSELPEDTAAPAEDIDRVPRRVKSKLPSEDVRPRVKKGFVARAIKSFSSFDRGYEQTDVFATGNEILAEAQPLSKVASSPLFGRLPPKVPESGSNQKVNNDAEDRGLRQTETNSEEAAKGILDGSDEELQLSFSAAPAQKLDTNHPFNNASTSSEEDLFVRDTHSEGELVEEGSSKSAAVQKISSLFYHDFNIGPDDRQAPGGSGNPPENSSSTENEQFPENIVEVTGISIDDVHDEGEASLAAVEEAAEIKSDGSMGSNGAPLISVMERADLTSHEHDEGVPSNEFRKKPKEVERASIDIADTADSASRETDESAVDEAVVQGTSSSGESSSTACYEDNGESVVDAGSGEGSESVNDSDQSDQAKSSSEVITSSLEDDSDDVEVESSEIEEEDEKSEDAEDEDVEDEEVEDEESLDVSRLEIVEGIEVGEFEEVGADDSRDVSRAEIVEGIEVEEDDEMEIGDSRASTIHFVESLEQGVTSEDITGAGSDRDPDDMQEADGGNDNDPDNRDEDQTKGKTLWQMLNIFGAVMSSSGWIVF